MAENTINESAPIAASQSLRTNRKIRRRGATEGSVFRRRDLGLWAAVLSLGYRDGRRLRRTFYASTQAEVIEKLTKARDALRQNLPVAAPRETLGDFLTRWLEDSAKPRIKPRSYERFAELIRLHINPRWAVSEWRS